MLTLVISSHTVSRVSGTNTRACSCHTHSCTTPKTPPRADPLKLSSSFGQYDLAGFEKASASWFRAWWLATPDPYNTDSRPEWDRPPVPEVRVVHIVQDLQPESRPPSVRAGQVDNVAQVLIVFVFIFVCIIL